MRRDLEKSRLRLTLAHAGTLTLLALLGLLWQLPTRWMSGPVTLWRDFWLMTALVGVYLLINLPFDIIGGWYLRRRRRSTLRRFAAAYARAALLHGQILTTVAFLLLLAGRTGCLPAVLGAQLLMMLFQVRNHIGFTVVIGGAARVQRDLGSESRLLRRWGLSVRNVTVLDSQERAFTGGLSGMPRRERLVLPAQWLDAINSQYAAIQIVRRAGALKDGSRRRGLLVALLFNVVGFGFATFAPGAGIANAAELATSTLAFTVLSFAGHIFWLPTLSRLGVFESDRFAAGKGIPKRQLRKAFALSDWQADARARRPLPLEQLFYAVPTRERRLEQLRTRRGPPGAWNAQQMTLFLSWSCLGWLCRAVGNSGRPALWVMPYGD